MPDIFNARNIKKTKAKKKKSKKSKKVKAAFKTKIPSAEGLAGHTHNPLSAFSFYPERVKFITEDPEEQVVLLLRRHPITNIRWIFIAFVMFITPSAISIFPFVEGVPSGFQVVFLLIWYMVVVAFIFEQFLTWFFNVNIITDERIIEVDFVNMVYREITDANIDQIQDVTVEMAGAVRTFFNFGEVLIQTAAQEPKIEFEAVPQPDRVSRILRDLRVQEEAEKIEGRVR
jgi:membrane protein YdbS with pleckstrin-like domain